MGEVVALRGEPELPVDPERLGTGQLVVDLVYDPLVTPLVAAARTRGIAAVNGLGMLIHQAALAFRLWTGEDAPLEAMSAGALAALKEAIKPDSGASKDDIQAKIDTLNTKSQEMGAAMYAAAEADSAAAGGTTGATGEADDDVVDAEIVDEPTGDDAEGTEGGAK